MTNWELLGFIKASKYRLRIMRILAHKPEIPSTIATQLGIRVNHVSRTLLELKEKGLIECKTPDMKRGRIYTLTSTGERMFKQFLNENDE